MLLVADIHVASFGADQFNLGTTEPCSSAIVLVMEAWTPGHASDGSGLSSSASVSESLEDVKIPLSSSISLQDEGRFELGRTMPSARRYSKNGGGSGINRALGVEERYLDAVSGSTTAIAELLQRIPEVVRTVENVRSCYRWKWEPWQGVLRVVKQ